MIQSEDDYGFVGENLGNKNFIVILVLHDLRGERRCPYDCSIETICKYDVHTEPALERLAYKNDEDIKDIG